MLAGFSSLAAVAMLGACAEAMPAIEETVVEESGGHLHAAPHGGILVELGEEFGHIELVLDRASGRLTAFVLDGEAENFKRISQEVLELIVEPEGSAAERSVSLSGVANPLTGETTGNTSEFVTTDAGLKTEGPVTGRVSRILLDGSIFEDVSFRIDP